MTGRTSSSSKLPGRHECDLLRDVCRGISCSVKGYSYVSCRRVLQSKRPGTLSGEDQVTHIEEGFDFLGQNVRKYNGKPLIRPSRKNVSAFLDKVRRLIKANKQAKSGSLIALLNPIIRGWTYYHRHVASSAMFSKVSSAI